MLIIFGAEVAQDFMIRLSRSQVLKGLITAADQFQQHMIRRLTDIYLPRRARSNSSALFFAFCCRSFIDELAQRKSFTSEAGWHAEDSGLDQCRNHPQR